MTVTLTNFVEVLIMWFVPNLFFGWKVGGGGKLTTFEKLSGQYVSSIWAFIGTVMWLAIVNWWLYPTVSVLMESFFSSLDPNYNAAVMLVMGTIAYWVFKRERLA